MSERSRVRSASHGAFVMMFAAVAWLSVAGTVVHARDAIDVDPPRIEHEALASGEAGVTQKFTATVVDDRELEDVWLFHRHAGEDVFERTPMRRLGTSSVFGASLASVAGDTRSIEYYIQARDVAGNRVLRGYAFKPLVRRMSPGSDPGDGDGTPVGAGIGGSPEPAVRTGDGNRRWLYIGLGVLAAGALAAAAAGSGGDSDESDPNTFFVTLDPPG